MLGSVNEKSGGEGERENSVCGCVRRTRLRSTHRQAKPDDAYNAIR